MSSNATLEVVLCISLAATACAHGAPADLPSDLGASSTVSESAAPDASIKSGLSMPELEKALADLERQAVGIAAAIASPIEQNVREALGGREPDKYEVSDELHKLFREGQLASLAGSAVTRGALRPQFPSPFVAWRYETSWLTLEATHQPQGWELAIVVRGAGTRQVVSLAELDENGLWTTYTSGSDWTCLWREIPRDDAPPTISACICKGGGSNCGQLPSFSGHLGLTPIIQSSQTTKLERNEDFVVIPLR